MTERSSVGTPAGGDYSLTRSRESMDSFGAVGSSSLDNASNEVQIAAGFWKEFDLDSKRLTLDKQCIEMKELKSASMAGRKRLNEATKAFRAKPAEEQLKMMLDVLKAYQEEIDQLSKRSKYSEAAFYGLYKAIYDAPDPATLIEDIMTHVNTSSSYQLEIERLRSELQQVKFFLGHIIYWLQFHIYCSNISIHVIVDN